MDMARSRKHSHLPSGLLLLPHLLDQDEQDIDAQNERLEGRFRPAKRPGSQLCILLLVLLLVAGSIVFLGSPSGDRRPPPRPLRTSPGREESAQDRQKLRGEDESSGDGLLSGDERTAGGLHSGELLGGSQCKSRALIHRFRPKSSYAPSPYLQAKLRKYEALHRNCGPGTASFHRNVDLLLNRGNESSSPSSFSSSPSSSPSSSSSSPSSSPSCQYVVWIAYSGLGNRILSIASTFVYALLTERVLLLDGSSDLAELFCEPFPSSSWLLPPAFALPLLIASHRFSDLLRQSPLRIPNTGPVLSSAPSLLSPLPPFAFVNLTHSYGFHDKLLFCPPEHALLDRIPWLIFQTNLYFVPSLYLYLPHFRSELERLFPQREAVFHLVGRYLFYPTDPVWSWITRFYQAYLAKASLKVGIQIRTFVSDPVALPYVVDQILACAVENELLPNVTEDEQPKIKALQGDSIAVLVTSLLPDYSERIRDIYLDHPTGTGAVVSVHQPSHELHQQTQRHGHNMKAWAEICLLSFSDKLITSPMSTFGYVAQGLAGTKSWILARVENDTVPSPVCSRTPSVDPCFHAPPYFDCILNRGADTSDVLPFVKHCEDVHWGLKLFPASDS